MESLNCMSQAHVHWSDTKILLQISLLVVMGVVIICNSGIPDFAVTVRHIMWKHFRCCFENSYRYTDQASSDVVSQQPLHSCSHAQHCFAKPNNLHISAWSVLV